MMANDHDNDHGNDHAQSLIIGLFSVSAYSCWLLLVAFVVYCLFFTCALFAQAVDSNDHHDDHNNDHEQ